ncbi:MAG: hypothetical protein J2P22_12665 [Nocardioides sp.]|nr:hypothetical protein [Nocardioides sp.]
MRIDVDSTSFVTVCSYLYDMNHDVVDSMNTLVSALGGCGAMAGSDTCGEAWAAQYDPAAAQAVEAGCRLGDAAAHFANLSNAALVNHRAADGGAQLSGPPEFQGSNGDHNPDHYGESLVTGAPPSAKGGTGDVPGWWHWLAGHLEGWFWPDADTGKLRTAGAAWSRAASDLTGTTYLIDGAIADYALITSPEVHAATGALGDLRSHVTDLATAFTDLGRACTQYAQDVEDKHQEIENELQSFLEWTAGIEIGGAILGALSFGLGEGGAQIVEGAEIANAANRVRRVLEALLELARAVAETVSTILARIGETLGKITGFLRGGPEIAEIEEAGATDAMAAVRTMSAQGERDAQIVKNTTRIDAPSGKAAYRIPDELNSVQLGEVKNVARQGWSSQLSDFYDYATSQAPPLKMVLYVRQDTTIVGRLAQLVADGEIDIVRKLPAVVK